MNKKRNIASVFIPLVLAIGIAGGIFIGIYIARRSVSPGQEKLETILALVKDQYVDDIDIDSLIEQSIPDILTSLDPHSVYFPASELTESNEMLEGSFGGVGVSFQIINDSIKVIEVIAGGPAENVGIQPGDIILEANGKKISGAKATTQDVYSALKGKEGTKVRISVKRKSSKKPLTFEVTRGIIPEYSVDTKYMISDSVGYLRVSKFAKTTYSEFFNALVDLQKKGAKKFIVDLRGNSGGFMDQAIYMANEFLPAGKMIVYSKGRRPENETMAISDGSGQFQNSELTVLTNEFSASASEIFSGAIQDNDRGLVIGRRSFGKGLVQNPIVLPDSSSIRLTVARYYTPSGRSIQKEYNRGKSGKYDLDILDRYNHGEFYSQDSIKFDKRKQFLTGNGRKVYGGGGIMPDIFVPEDTTGYTSYFIEAVNQGLIQKFANDFADSYRGLMNGKRDLETLYRILPRDNMLLNNFVNYAAARGLPARWFYINRSRNLLLNQIKAVIARDLVSYDAFIQILNETDVTVKKALEALDSGMSPVNITAKKKSK